MASKNDGDGRGSGCGNGMIHFKSGFDLSFSLYNEYFSESGYGMGHSLGWGTLDFRSYSPLFLERIRDCTGPEATLFKGAGSIDCTGGGE